MAIKTPWNWHKDRNPWNKIEGREVNPYIYGQPVSDKVSKGSNGERNSFPQAVPGQPNVVRATQQSDLRTHARETRRRVSHALCVGVHRGVTRNSGQTERSRQACSAHAQEGLSFCREGHGALLNPEHTAGWKEPVARGRTARGPRQPTRREGQVRSNGKWVDG